MRAKPEREAAEERKTRINPFSAWGILRFSTILIGVALLFEAGFNALIPLSVRFFIDRAIVAQNRDPLYLMVGVLAGEAVIAVTLGLLRDFLSARVESRSLGGLRQSMFEP